MWVRLSSRTYFPMIFLLLFIFWSYSMSYRARLWKLRNTHIHFIKHIDTIWAIWPVSHKATKYVAGLVHQYVDQHTYNGTIVELGPGTGNITDYLVHTWWNLHIFEIDDKFVTQLHDRYDQYSNFHLHHCSAEYITDHIKSPVDIIVTTIPMTLLWPKADIILSQCAQILKPWWIFVSAQIRSKQESQYRHHIWEQQSSKTFLWLQPIRVTSFVRSDKS